MNYTLFDLVNAIAVGFFGVGLGYIIGNVRGRHKAQQRPGLPFIIYDRDS